jgi:hypothetical protein
VAGLNPDDKSYAVQCLRRLQAWGKSSRCPLIIKSDRLVPWARVPILKLTLRSGPEVDISLGDRGGRAAAEFVLSMSRSYPLLRPLVLVIKSLLRLVRGGGRPA